MTAHTWKRVATMTVAGALVASLSAIPAYALTDVGLDDSASSQSASQVQAIGDQQLSDEDSIPDNPTQELPSTVSDDIPADATVVSPELAVSADGEVQNIETGETVTDPELVGTQSQQPDPLAKTDGESFIPVQVEEVRQKVGETDSDVDTAGEAGDSADDSATSGSPDESAGSSQPQQSEEDSDSVQDNADESTDAAVTPSALSTEGMVRLASLGGNEYGAYWGTYNSTPAFFEGSGTLFVQQAKGVVDVSEWQGTIDWQAAKNAGVEGAIIRISYGAGNGLDKQAKRNISECKRLGIPFGIYTYSYAYDNALAADEGDDIVSLLKQVGVSPSDLSYPVYYDLEEWTWTGHTPPTNPSVYDGIVSTWYSKLQAAGYKNLGVYSYTSYLKSALNSSSIHSKTTWVASYGSRTNFDYPTNSRGWQYTSGGTVAGISGRVDLNAFGNKTYQAEYDVRNLSTISIPDGTYYINSVLKDSSSVEIAGGGAANGVKTQLYQYNHTKAQQFRFTKQSDGSYVIQNVNSGKVLDVSNGSAGNGAVVQQYDANGTTAQRWFIRDSGAGYYVQSALGNWVLDISGAATTNGTAVALYAPNNSQAQKFVMASTDASVPTGKKVRVTSMAKSNMVMDISGGSVANGAKVQLYAWNETDAQRYTFTEVGNNVYRIVNVKSGKVLDAASGATGNGTAVQQYESNGTTAQHWHLMKVGSGYAFLNSKSGKAIDIPSGNASSGAKLQLYTSNMTKAQLWTVSEVTTMRERLDSLAASHKSDLPDGTYAIASMLKTSTRVEVAGASTANGGNVQLYAGNGTDAQVWKVTHDAKGYVTFTNAVSGKVMDIYNAGTSSGTNVHQYASNGSWAQKWIVVKNSNGSYTIRAATSESQVLDVSAGSTANGANIQIYADNGSNAQRWKITTTKTVRERLNSMAQSHKNDLPDGIYEFSSSVGKTMRLDVSGGSKNNGGNVQIYAANGTSAQRWRISHDAQGYVTLASVNSGKVLDVENGTSSSGTNVQQYAANGTWAQKWIAVKGATGDYVFYSALAENMVLDVSGGYARNGTNVQLYVSNGTAAQRWSLKK
ncbi:1,4-beta-N-acetylmuramidase [Bifidobacterium lemurum]|uniref:1,4-beta-N-acetylmuramidase n=1 Tax=Bifidobacterium lemurum TaxID=1603886 RepID=A0A261FRM6_9BIFI|nr:RICIN domain-containing protein [Bifidobacterium lemurum]OZG61789.1 1,4-beta-N-acetylmuramidase [Bifidobacterium lemurum]QOL34941.1 RICIN domain-containing protein [Bifidobacterium lemurum]